jgi:aspartate/methionine/tyrosine aminotransferase
MKLRINVYLEAPLLDQVEKLAARQKLTKSLIIEAAVAAFLSPDSADQREAAFTRRLDLLTRQVERLERNVEISAEAVALFVRFWLITTPPVLESTERHLKINHLA